jgi:hypothetical protein
MLLSFGTDIAISKLNFATLPKDLLGYYECVLHFGTKNGNYHLI